MAGVTVLEVSNLITTAVFPNNHIRSTQPVSTCVSVPLEKIRIYGIRILEGKA